MPHDEEIAKLAGWDPDKDQDGAKRRIRLTSVSSVKRRQVAIVPCGLNIPVGTISVICGEQGLGKSLITCYAAAELTRHGHGVIFIADEDSVEAVLKPRLEAVQADLDHVYFPEVVVRDDLGGIALPRDTAELAELGREAGVLLTVIDPWTNHLDVDVDKGAVRGALMPIARAGRDGGFAVLLVAHPTKRTEGSPLSQIAHASAVSQIARSAFFIAADPGKEDVENPYRLVTQEKNNLTPRATTLRFKIQSVVLPACDGEPEAATAKVVSDGTSMLDWAGICLQARRQAPKADTAEGRARAWLQEFLSDGPQPRDTVMVFAAEESHAERTVQRASQGLVRSIQAVGRGATWELLDRRANPEQRKNVGATGAAVEVSQKNNTPAHESIVLGSAAASAPAAPRATHEESWRSGDEELVW